MTPTIGDINAEIRERLLGPRADELVALEQKALDRHKIERGYEAAAAMHARVDRSTQVHNSPICQACTDLAVLAAGHDEEWPLVVEWPCDTAKALGLDR